MKTNDLILMVLLIGLAMFVDQANNEKLTTIFWIFIGSIIVFYIIQIVMLCLEDDYLFRYLILFVGAVLTGILAIFTAPYVIPLAQSISQSILR